MADVERAMCWESRQHFTDIEQPAVMAGLIVWVKVERKPAILQMGDLI
jgi:hypothetical protein